MDLWVRNALSIQYYAVVGFSSYFWIFVILGLLSDFLIDILFLGKQHRKTLCSSLVLGGSLDTGSSPSVVNK